MIKILTIKDATKIYDTEKLVWKNVNITLNPGEIVGLIGANGSGKTTLFRSILGVISLNDGIINSNLNLENDVGYLLEIDLFKDLSARDNLKVLGLYSNQDYNNIQINQALEKVGLIEVKNKKVKSFSFGMIQRLRLAAAIIVKRKLLLLDEPLVGLDPQGIDYFINTIKKVSQEDNTTVVISTHQIAEVSNLFERYFYIEENQIFEKKVGKNYYEILIDKDCDVEQLKLAKEIKVKDDILIVPNIHLTVKTISYLNSKNINILDIRKQESIIREVF